MYVPQIDKNRHPIIKAEIRISDGRTLWIKTDHDTLEKVNRVIVEEPAE